MSRGVDEQKGDIPQGKDDVIGAVVGTADFDWAKSGSRLMPGAIAEALTSYGGHFNKRKQTKLTSFLRHGAAGSSGAVAEPFTFQEKFPVPMLHVYYSEGCSLAEAFYQSIRVPYQLLVVGDPLARPFAQFSTVQLKAPDPSLAWSGTISISAAIEPAPQRPIGHIELWVDGQHLGDFEPDNAFHWDTRLVDDGSHDLRLVAVEAGLIETRSYIRVPITVQNTPHRVTVSRPSGYITYGENIQVSGSAPGARKVQIWQGHRQLGSVNVKYGSWPLSIDSKLVVSRRLQLRRP